MRNKDIRREISRDLQHVAVIDPHCHLDPARPAASTVAHLVLYHHVWVELVSAGMDARLVSRKGLPHELAPPGMDPLERVRLALPYLPLIRNTLVGTMLGWLLGDLYDIRGSLDNRALNQLAERVASEARDPFRADRVLGDRCGIEQAVTVEGPGAGRILSASEALRWLNLADGKSTPLARLKAMEELYGEEIRRASDFDAYARRLIRTNVTPETVFMGAWLPPGISAELASDVDVDATLSKARRNENLSPTESGGTAFFGMRAALEELRRTHLRTIQVIAGAEVLPPHRSVTHWHPAFCGALSRLAGEFEDFRFNLSSASDHYTQDMAIMAKHIPNVSVAGYWWHTLYPFYIRKSLETRLDIVPAGKIVAFFSDAYHCEWCYPKLRLVKEILGDILVDRVERGWYDLDTAKAIIPTVFHDAPAAIYRSTTSGSSGESTTRHSCSS